VRVKVAKNKVAPPFREAEFDILYGSGISHEGELIDLGVEHGVIEKSGAWYAFGTERLGQGKENVRALIQENDALRRQIHGALLERLGLSIPETPEEVQAPTAETLMKLL